MDVEYTKFSAPGKIILFGEHAVVYGYPALVMAINLRAECTIIDSSNSLINVSFPDIHPELLYTYNYETMNLTTLNKQKIDFSIDNFSFIIQTLLENRNNQKTPSMTINSDIPVGVGLGSSAAIAVSTISSLSKYFDIKYSLEEINQLAYETEMITHGKPSGIDNTISTYGGIQYYKERKFEKLKNINTLPYLVIVNSGIARNTKDYVEVVAKSRKKDPVRSEKILNSIGDIVEEAKICLLKNDYPKLGELMDRNQKLLDELGVGHNLLTKLIDITNQNGALGSKLTGAGGGGCIISLFENKSNAIETIKKLKRKGYQALLTKYSELGVKKEVINWI